MIKYYIPTNRSRSQQITLNTLPPAMKEKIHLAVYEDEIGKYENWWDKLLICPRQELGIATKRQFIMENSDADFVVMLDDDLRFLQKKSDRTKMEVATNSTISDAFSTMEGWLMKDNFIHIGMLHRIGANRVLTSFVENTRIMHIHCFNRKVFMEEGIRFNRLKLMSDFDVTLQLLKKGHKNRIFCDCVSNPGKPNATGGCSEYRTPAILEEAAVGLANLHPFHVNTRLKLTSDKTWKNFGGLRTDVTVQWKKAYNDPIG